MSGFSGGELTKQSKGETHEEGAQSRQLTPNIFENSKSKDLTKTHSERSSPHPTPIAHSERKSVARDDSFKSEKSMID